MCIVEVHNYYKYKNTHMYNCLKLKGEVEMVVLKGQQTRVVRDNQHIHGTSLRLRFSLEYCRNWLLSAVRC